jgi:hypothetical protein
MVVIRKITVLANLGKMETLFRETTTAEGLGAWLK